MTKRQQVRIGAAGLVTGTELSNTTRNSLRVTTDTETQISAQIDCQRALTSSYLQFSEYSELISLVVFERLNRSSKAVTFYTSKCLNN
jgi:hypothetical protein